MGIYISAVDCEQRYNIKIKCDIVLRDNGTNTTIGGYEKGYIPTDPDIAGVGVVYSFIATTSIALLLSIFSVIALMRKRYHLSHYEPKPHLKNKRRKFHTSEFFEELVLSASDTQIFTGAAYAFALRYFKGCNIIAYHYDVVTMVMLLTCATHLMAVTIVRNYWKWPWLGLIRVVVCSGVFIVTGILLANQNNDSDDEAKRFPAAVPYLNKTIDSILLPAACFEKGNSQLWKNLDTSFGDNARDSILYSKPGTFVPGWNNYLITLLLYVLAGLIDIARFVRREVQSKPGGKRDRLVQRLSGKLKSLAERQSRQQRQQKNPQVFEQQQQQKQAKPRNERPIASRGTVVFLLFCLYLCTGIGVSCWTVAVAGKQITDLRTWARSSGWLVAEGGFSAEDDATSFGQLVPIFLNLLLIFTISQVLSRAFFPHSDRKFDIYGGIISDDPGSGSPNSHQPDEMHMEVKDSTTGLKTNAAIQVQSYSQGHSHSMSNLPPQSASPHPTVGTNGQWSVYNTASQPTTPGPGIMTTTPTSAQIVQFPSTAMSPTSQHTPRHSNMSNLQQSSAHSVPTSPLAGGHGISPYQQQFQQQRSMSMTSSPQSLTYFQPTHPTASSPVMFQPPQYGQTHSSSPPPQWNQNQGQPQGQGYY
ncbi:hypothetical protein V8F06_009654 [Rhypophila decipiens]